MTAIDNVHIRKTVRETAIFTDNDYGKARVISDKGMQPVWQLPI